jgi:hypothetical protein
LQLWVLIIDNHIDIVLEDLFPILFCPLLHVHYGELNEHVAVRVVLVLSIHQRGLEDLTGILGVRNELLSKVFRDTFPSGQADVPGVLQVQQVTDVFTRLKGVPGRLQL